jgi:hypothetical protein
MDDIVDRNAVNGLKDLVRAVVREELYLMLREQWVADVVMESVMGRAKAHREEQIAPPFPEETVTRLAKEMAKGISSGKAGFGKR